MSLLDSSASTVVGGWLTFAGAAWIGRALTVRLSSRAAADEPLFRAAAPIFGLGIVALIVEFLALGQRTPRTVLVGIGITTMILGAVQTLEWWPLVPRRIAIPESLFGRVMLGCAVAATIATAVAAIAPSTKIDELHYHMLVPLRIVQDGGLRFYRMPWEGAILPHMLFQVGYAPLHALGIPDGGNVVEWAVATTCLVFAYRFVLERSGDDRLASVAVATIAVGMYAVVSHASAGAHAIGDASLAIGGVALVRGLEDAEERGCSLVLACVAALCAAASKLSVWPLAAAITIIALWQYLLHAPSGAGKRARVRTAGMVLLGWVVTFVPAATWLWVHSGSPLGPVLAAIVPHSAYDVAEVQFQLTRARGASGSQWGLLMTQAIGYSPLLWLLVACAVFGTTLPRSVRRLLAALLVGQGVLIVALMAPQPRYLGGLHYAAVIVGCAYAGRWLRATLDHPIARTMAATAVVPWALAPMLYVLQFIPVEVGLTSRNAFEDRYVALHRDLQALDRLLPPSARILVPYERFPTVSFPRPTYLNEADVPSGSPTYFLSWDPAAARSLRRFVADSLVYVDSTAMIQVYRTPGRAADRGVVWVWRLRPTPVP